MAISRKLPVLDKDLTIPPISPADGSGNYIVPLVATGVWENHGNQIAWPLNLIWRFDIPNEGWVVLVQDEGLYYQFKNGTWILLPEGIEIENNIIISSPPKEMNKIVNLYVNPQTNKFVVIYGD